MARTDNDSWDLASSVGATATMVAVARALASREPQPLITDPLAEPLVKAVGVGFFTKVLDGEIPLAVADDPRFNMSRMIDLLAVRTRFFDEFFTAATDSGVRQAVILASGLDSRAYRLRWPSGCVVFEIDQPEVIEFKTRTLSELGAAPSADHRPVSVDLRDDWPAALRDNGFDDSTPTAWSAEGLLVYLPPEAQDRLFDHITTLSAPGSQLATEYHPDGVAAMRERSEAMRQHWRDEGLDLDFSDLIYQGDRNLVTEYLIARGWHVSTQTRGDLFARYGRLMPDDDDSAPFRKSIAVTAIRQ